jgi:hypothetical protein
MYIGNSPAGVGNYQVVDDISSTFNGVLTSFALTAASLAINPAKSGQLLVSINGVLQEPDDTGTEGFKVSGSNIVFSSAPATGSTFWAVFQGQNVDIGTPSDGTVGTAQMSYPLDNFTSTGIDDNATSTAITIDASENVGIGVAPSHRVHAKSSAADSYIYYGETSDASSGFGVYEESDTSCSIFARNASATLTSAIRNNGGASFLNGGGDVGIGTSNPTKPLDVVGDIRTSTGILFGTDTAAANALDDYETGTWTPVVKFGGTTQSITGVFSEYIKIGKQVTIFMRWYINTSVSGTGNMEVEGLPFTPDTANGFYLAMPCFTDRFVIDDGYIGATVYSGDTKLRFSKAKNSNTSGIVSVTNTDVSSNNSQIRMVLTYQTA